MFEQTQTDTGLAERSAASPTLRARLRALPPRPRLHRLFEAASDRYANSTAVECGDERLTYAELDARANRLARRLKASGVGSGTRVGIALERSLDMYAALLAVPKAGGVLVPIDAATPSERAAFIAEDASLALIVTTSDLAATTAATAGCPTLELDTIAAELAALDGDRLPDAYGSVAADPRSDPAEACYVIYTSGSTGRPKGVEVSHANVCRFLASVAPVYRYTADDRVYQGITIAFDFSVEEIWVCWAAGATLVAGPTDDRRFGPGLAEFLIERRVSVLCCVPTLLASIDRDLPALRTLLVGGEACPPELVQRWARPGRRMLNTYGPTETTVTATWTELRRDRPVTIGRPLPGYSVHILDERLEPVAPGEIGEICVGGPCVAVGYVGLPERTAERFVADPFSDVAGARLYRTGDLGRLDADGEIEFHGRSDAEVKLRGYRIDLGEIESVLLEDAEVQGAVVTRVESPTRGAELAAFIVRGGTSDTSELETRLADRLTARLPAYMVPAYLDAIERIPTSASGKSDRAALPEPERRLGATSRYHVEPETDLERRIAALWAEVLGHPRVSVDADFFLDLGGHSLAAATAVSELRTDAALRQVAIADVYQHPTVRSLAQAIERAAEDRAAADATRPRQPARKHSSLRVAGCGAVQSLTVYVLVAIVAAPLVALTCARAGRGGLGALITACGLLPAVAIVASVGLPLLTRPLLAGIAPGSYPLWGRVFVRIWLARKLLAVSPLGLLSGSPLAPAYLRLLGARIGKRCQLASPQLGLPALLTIGDDVSIGAGAVVQQFTVEAGSIELAPVTIGEGAFVGANSVILAGATLGARTGLADQSLAATGQAIPAGEWWSGSPATRQDVPDEIVTRALSTPAGPERWARRQLAVFAAILAALLLLPWIAVAAPVALVARVAATDGLGAALIALAVAAPIYVAGVCALVAAGARLAGRGIAAGVFPLRSWVGLRKWAVDKLLELSLLLTNTLYATLYAGPWMRALGARVGRRAEISTLAHVDPVLLTLGSESFCADLSAVGSATYVDGRLALAETVVEPRSFVGNAALVRSGTTLARGSLVGAHTVAPDWVPEGTSWLGSPAIFLPRRQDSGDVPERLTYRPSKARVAARLAIEYLRVTLPATIVGAAAVLAAAAELALARALSFLATLALTPVVLAAAGVAVLVAVAAIKWAVVGRYRPRVEPLWSTFVRRTELVTGIYEAAAVPMLLNTLTGTPLIGPALRLLGVRVGRRVWLDTTFTTEFDLVRIGDDAAVGALSSLQTHLFEDRVMKMSRIDIQAAASVGTRSIVLYDSHLGERAVLDSLSLAMKGETLPADTRWRGIPAA